MSSTPSPEVKISLEINGRTWQQVSSLDLSGPRDRHFTVQQEADGRAVLQFGDGAHGARPPSGARNVAVTYSPGSAYVSVVLQQGRVIIDQDQNEERFCSLYRGIVTNNNDPEGRLRLQVRVPEVLGLEPAWAEACLSPGANTVPAAGKYVWVMFEHGDSSYPVWIGTMKIEG